MNDFKVKKGLEKPLKIQGMLMNYFYSWLVASGVGVIIVIMKIMQFSRNSNVSFMSFVLVVIFVVGVVLGLKFYFVYKSKFRKIKFGKLKTVVSNVDIMNVLK